MDAMDAQLLELDAQMDHKSLFVDAFQYFGQESSYSSLEEDVKPELVPGGLPHMIPGSRRFATPSPPLGPPLALETAAASDAVGQPQSILLHTGANVVDMVSGVTCSGLGLGAIARLHDRDVVSDLNRTCSSAADQRPAFGQHQGNFGHLLRQRPASHGGEVCAPPSSQNLQVVTRQRPRSEDLHGLRVLEGQDYDDDDDEDDDDVFLDSSHSFRPTPRPRLSSSNSNESDDDDLREEAVTECRWSECGLQFAGRAPLVRHIEKVHVEPRRGEDFSCLWRCCPRGARPFNARYKLLIHMRVHSGEKPNKCPVAGCPKAFSRLENLKIHQRSHTGERPYCCQFAGCNKAFSNSSDRAKHQRTHFDTKPYACQVPGCSKRYTDPSSLRKHVKNHSGKDHAHAQARRAGSTGSTSSTADSEASTNSGGGVGDVDLDDALFPSADDIDQAIREFIPFDEVGKMLAEPTGVSGFDLHEPLEFDFDPSFWNCSA
ncbi:zinc finger protein GLI1-like [Thrips palmi]|uniref:Zinc finger protein GLI1-like n=1 Tax=Thrips palmi TaxID=161013 RepID=A0A6P9A9A6_THRPL|nr:zinc finger protein GLI1-like [Thrips palmi]